MAAAARTVDECDLYLRISLDKAGLEFGVDRQEKACRELCDRQGWRIRHVWKDNSKSATKGRRPAFEDMIVTRPPRIIMWSVDRLVRKGEDLERLIKLDVPVHSVMAGPMDLATASGRLNARLLTSVATFEGEMKAERQIAANVQKAGRGEPRWPCRPFGLEWDGSLRQDEADVVAECYDLLLNGGSLAGMARMLNERGIATSLGNQWTQASMRDLLESPRNAGIRTYKGEEVGKGTWAAIVPDDVYRKAARLMSDPARRKKPLGVTRRHLLTAIGTCGKCGGPLKVQRHRSSRKLMYMCSVTYCCAVSQEWLDGFVRHAAKRVLNDPASAHVFTTSSTTDVHALRAVVETADREMDEFVADRKAGLLDRAHFNELYAAALTRRDEAQLKLEESKGISPVSAVANSGDVDAAWDAMLLEAERTAVKWLFPVIQVLPRGKGKRHLGPEHVIMRHRGSMPEESVA